MLVLLLQADSPALDAPVSARADRINAWLGKLPSTNATIVVGLYLAAVFVHTCLIADMMGRPISDGTQATLGFFIASMLGVGVSQFWVKRKTDDHYVAAKSGGPPTPPRKSTAMPALGGEP